MGSRFPESFDGGGPDGNVSQSSGLAGGCASSEGAAMMPAPEAKIEQ